MISNELLSQVRRHEGLRLKAYQDIFGYWTIGYGRNLQELEIEESLANKWLMDDLWRAKRELFNNFPFTTRMDYARQDALVNMVFNLGITRFKGFKNMISALEVEDYDRAADEVLDSNYAKQVGARAKEISEQIRTGKYAG